MGTILEFSRGATNERQLRGPARCLHCQHEWEAVSPAGTFDELECPSCALSKGVRKGLAIPELVLECLCGSDIFFITPRDCSCAVCGRPADLPEPPKRG